MDEISAVAALAALSQGMRLRVFRALEATPGNVVRVYRDGPLVSISIHIEEAKS